MIGTLPATGLVPLEYRVALDAVAPALAAEPWLRRCPVPALAEELAQRFPRQTAAPASLALWLEPQAADWRAAARELAGALPDRARLLLIAAQPLARLVPERRAWGDQPLGLRLGGLAALRRLLRAEGFRAEQRHAMHSLVSIALLRAAHAASRFGRPDLGDRLHFAARLRYTTAGLPAHFATVGLWRFRRGGGP